MEGKIKLSVIMPVYNGEKHIDQAVESVLAQSLKELELIVINDASKDRTLELLREWEKKDSRLHIIDKKNEGVSVARNTGIAAANGEYITFVDADDFVELDAYEKTISLMVEKATQAALFGFFDQTEQTKEEIGLPWETGTVLDQNRIWNELIPYMIKVFPEDPFQGNIFGSVWRLVVNRQALLEAKVQFDPLLHIAEDFAFCTELYARLENMVIINECFYHYMRWGNTTMAVYRKNQFQEGMENQHRLKKFLIKEGRYEQLERRYVGSYVDVCIGALVNFVRPGAPGLFQIFREMELVVHQIADDDIYEKLHLIPLSKNQKRVLHLIHRKKVITIYMLTKLRQIKKGRK